MVRLLAHELHVIPAKMVTEIEPWHADKVSAICTFMNEPPFKGRVPVFPEGDTTDENRIVFVSQMNDYAIRAGGGDGNCVESSACYGLEDINDVIAWPRSWPSSL